MTRVAAAGSSCRTSPSRTKIRRPRPAPPCYTLLTTQPLTLPLTTPLETVLLGTTLTMTTSCLLTLPPMPYPSLRPITARFTRSRDLSARELSTPLTAHPAHPYRSPSDRGYPPTRSPSRSRAASRRLAMACGFEMASLRACGLETARGFHLIPTAPQVASQWAPQRASPPRSVVR